MQKGWLRMKTDDVYSAVSGLNVWQWMETDGWMVTKFVILCSVTRESTWFVCLLSDSLVVGSGWRQMVGW
jgi:hypothetical protein